MRLTSFAVGFIVISLSAPAAGSDNRENQARRSLLDFITEAGMLDGRVGVCNVAEADLIQACATRIADSWSKITGLPSVGNPAFKQTVTEAWSAAVVASAATQSRRNPSTCHAVLADSRGSGIWKICGRPYRAVPEIAPAPSPAYPPQ